MDFLKPGASVVDIIEAIAQNHREWFDAKTVASAGVLHHEKNFTWNTYSSEVIAPFPRIESKDVDDFICRLIDECRSEGVNTGSVWNICPYEPPNLGAKLLSWGFETGWKPHWMSLDLATLPAEILLPVGLTVEVDNLGDWQADDMPYYSASEIENQNKLSRQNPRRFWRFIARLEGKVVGQSVMSLNEGAFGVAGIYNVGVIPSLRKRGIATALMLKLCRFAKDLGCNYATLNSAADGFYEKLGFESLGWGFTWWLHKAQIEAPPPTKFQRKFLEALGEGDLSALNELWEEKPSLDSKLNQWETLLQNGHTAMANAVASCKPESAEWLIQKGAIINVIQAWDINWKERIPAIIETNPGLIDELSSQGRITPLHQAVLRGDIELVKFLLEYNPDLGIKDSSYNSTPLGWANHFGHLDISEMIEVHSRRRHEA